MPWPKGVKRTGYVNKDGTPHAKKGDKLRVVAIVKVDDSVVRDRQGWPVDAGRTRRKGVSRAAIRQSRKVDAEARLVQDDQAVDQHWGYKGNLAVTEVCPNCHYVYADGGYCPECHWSAPVQRDPYGTNSGRMRK